MVTIFETVELAAENICFLFIYFFSVLAASGGDPYRPSAGAGEAGTGICLYHERTVSGLPS